MATYALGTLVRLRAIFRDDSGHTVDPGTVQLDFLNPNGITTTYVYGVNVQLVRVSEGTFYTDIDAEIHGTWFYRWHSTGVGQAAAESTFTVTKSQFVAG